MTFRTARVTRSGSSVRRIAIVPDGGLETTAIQHHLTARTTTRTVVVGSLPQCSQGGECRRIHSPVLRGQAQPGTPAAPVTAIESGMRPRRASARPSRQESGHDHTVRFYLSREPCSGAPVHSRHIQPSYGWPSLSDLPDQPQTLQPRNRRRPIFRSCVASGRPQDEYLSSPLLLKVRQVSQVR